MHWINSFGALRLDIVGIIAVLGEGSVTRNAQVTSLSWWSALPRLLPAPQALLEHERKYRLPTQAGIVAGAYSGLVKKEINFFAQLLHDKLLDDYEVELVQVTRQDGREGARSFGPKEYGILFWTSILGCIMSLALIALSAYYRDGFSLVAVLTLSMVSSFVGFGTHWELVFAEPTSKGERRHNALPRSDVVIYYPNGAIRVIRAEEAISRLYFQTEHQRYLIDDTPYRTLAFFATILLMAGVICLANATNILQVAFAAAYVLLNGLYWTVSALNPFKHHWTHSYKVTVLPLQPLPKGHGHLSKADEASKTEMLKRRVRHQWHRFENAWFLSKRRARTPTVVESGARNFTSALWTAIALTGTAQWLNAATHIAPVNEAWQDWLKKAESQARPNLDDGDLPDRSIPEYTERTALHRRPRISTGLDWNFSYALPHRRIKIKEWGYQEELTKALERHADKTRVPVADELQWQEDEGNEKTIREVV